MKDHKTCLHCGETFEPNRKDKIYCSDYCRKAHWKSKKKNEDCQAGALGQIQPTPNPYETMMMNNPNESVYRFAYEHEKEARHKAEAKLEKCETALDEAKKANVELEKAFIRKDNDLQMKDNEIMRQAEKAEEGEGLSGLTKNPEGIAILANAISGVLTALRVPAQVGGGEAVAPLQGVDLDKQKKAIEYANFLAQTEDPDQVHGTLHLAARVKKTLNPKIFEDIENYIKENYYDTGRQQAN